MKRTLLTLTFSFVALLAISKDIKSQLNQAPVNVLLYADDPVYNENIKHAIDNYWSLNEYIFINETEFSQLQKESANLFLVKNTSQSVDAGTLVYDEVLRLIQFTKNGRLMTQIAGMPVVKNNSNNAVVPYVNAVLGLQDKVQFEISKTESKTAFSHYNQKVDYRTNIVKLNKLYIAQEDLDSELSLDIVHELYSGELVIISSMELEKIISSGNADIVYAIVTNKQTSGFTYVNSKQIIDAATGQILYANESTTMKPEGFNKKDWKKLAD